MFLLCITRISTAKKEEESSTRLISKKYRAPQTQLGKIEVKDKNIRIIYQIPYMKWSLFITHYTFTIQYEYALRSDHSNMETDVRLLWLYLTFKKYEFSFL